MIVNNRKEAIPGFVKQLVKKDGETKQFIKSRSIFKNWNEPTADTYLKLLQNDVQHFEL